MKKIFVSFYPHHLGKSRQWMVPVGFFVGMKWMAIFFMMGLVYLNFFQLKLTYSTYSQTQLKEKNQNYLTLSSKILQDYSLAYSKKQKYLDRDIVNLSVSFNPNAHKNLKTLSKGVFNVGVGGKGERIRQSKLIDSYGEKLVDAKRLAFEEKTDFLQIIDKDILSMDDSLGLIRDFNIELGERKGLMRAFPLLWPVRNGKGLLINQESKDSNFFVRLDKDDLIVVTARGKVKQIVQQPSGKFNVMIKHGYGFNTHYLDVDQPLVEENQWVEKGESVGSTRGMFNYKIQIGTKFANPRIFALIKY